MQQPASRESKGEPEKTGVRLVGPGAPVIKTILFDLDGVVVYPWRFAEHLEKHHSITREHTRAFFEGVFAECLLGRLDLKDVLGDYLVGWGWKDSVQSFINCWFDTENCPEPRLLELIAGLRAAGYHCGLATNQESHRAHYIRKVMQFERLFDSLFFSCDLGFKKPNREYFYGISERLRVSPSTILFIDNEKPYVTGATGAGWNAILYTCFEDLFDKSMTYSFSQDDS